MNVKTRLSVCSVIACCLAVTGCGSSQHATGDTTFTRTTAGTDVQVKLDEYRIHMPTSIPAGHTVFQIANTGSHEHNIRITGQGVNAALPKNLEPGQSQDLTVDLKPGKYKVDCPVGPHSTLGMHLELTVTQS